MHPGTTLLDVHPGTTLLACLLHMPREVMCALPRHAQADVDR